MPCLALRIGFVGELGYELHCPRERRRRALGRARRGRARRPSGSRPQRVLRLEKAHLIVGQDTDSESTLASAGLGWLVKHDKPDFVGTLGRGAAARERGERERLVGFTMPHRTLPLEGAQVVRDGRRRAG